MSSYHSYFRFLDKNSKDFDWLIVAFDADNGEMDSYLTQEQVYTDSYNGAKRTVYGTKWTAVPKIKISVIKRDGSDFSLTECRAAYKWLTGSPQASWLDLYSGNVLKYSLLCTVQTVAPYKLDARTVGLVIYFESISPWAYSPLNEFGCSFIQKLYVAKGGALVGDSSVFEIDEDGVLCDTVDVLEMSDNGTLYIDNSVYLQVDNETDDLYTPIYLNVEFENRSSDYLSIRNITTDEETILTGMQPNEVIKMNAGKFIISDIPGKIFGNDFNFVWPKLAPGPNEFVISGSGEGTINFTYRYAIKIGDCAIDTDEINYDFYCAN